MRHGQITRRMRTTSTLLSTGRSITLADYASLPERRRTVCFAHASVVILPLRTTRIYTRHSMPNTKNLLTTCGRSGEKRREKCSHYRCETRTATLPLSMLSRMFRVRVSAVGGNSDRSSIGRAPKNTTNVSRFFGAFVQLVGHDPCKVETSDRSR